MKKKKSSRQFYSGTRSDIIKIFYDVFQWRHRNSSSQPYYNEFIDAKWLPERCKNLIFFQ